MRSVVVIPARYQSSRLPGKPLVELCGVPMIIRTWRQCLKAVPADQVYVATDDDRIDEVCRRHGAQVVRTSSDCLTGTDRVVWKETKRSPAKPSPLVVGSEVYVMEDGGIASCLDAATGQPYWSERTGGNYSASPLLADGRIYFFSQEGKVTVIAPGTTWQVLAENQLDGQLMASPVALDGTLLIRSDSALYRIQ